MEPESISKEITYLDGKAVSVTLEIIGREEDINMQEARVKTFKLGELYFFSGEGYYDAATYGASVFKILSINDITPSRVGERVNMRKEADEGNSGEFEAESAVAYFSVPLLEAPSYVELIDNIEKERRDKLKLLADAWIKELISDVILDKLLKEEPNV